MTQPDSPRDILNELMGHDDGVEFGNGYHDECKQEIDEALAKLQEYYDRLILDARLEEVRWLHKRVHAFDYVFNDRLKSLTESVGNPEDILRTCTKCGETKPLTMYAKDKHYSLGHIKQCKDCKNKQAREKKYLKPETKKAYRKKANENLNKYMKKYPEKYKANSLIAPHRAELRKDACENCGSKKRLHLHHPDYSKPLEVITLCVRCHENVHHRGLKV